MKIDPALGTFISRIRPYPDPEIDGLYRVDVYQRCPWGRQLFWVAVGRLQFALEVTRDPRAAVAKYCHKGASR